MTPLVWMMALLLCGCPQSSGTHAPTAPGAAGAAVRQAAAQPDPAQARELVVWADPVLVPALGGLAKDYHAATGGSYRVTPMERGALLDWAKTAPAAGQPAPDVLLFAGQSTYAALQAAQRMDEPSARTFAGDRLVVLKPLGSNFDSPTLFDLWDLHFKHIGEADPQRTALGLYTQQALIGDGVDKRLASRAQTVADTTALPGLPAQDPSTLTIAFMSQSGATKGVEPLLLVDKNLHEPIQYRAAAAAGKGTDPAALAFLRWLAEDDKTQTALGGYGFLSRGVALNLAAPLAPTSTGTPAAPTATPEAKP